MMKLFTRTEDFTSTVLWKHCLMILVMAVLTTDVGWTKSMHSENLNSQENDGARPFVTIWKTDNPGASQDNQIIIPTDQSEDLVLVYNYNVYWEEVDNPTNNGSLAGLTDNDTIDFPSPGVYKVKITGEFPKIFFNNEGDRSKILAVEQWGDIVWKNMRFAFRGCDEISINAEDAPDLSQVTDMWGTFLGSSINQNINHWDVSNVTNIGNLFRDAKLFNQPLDNWDVSNVTMMPQVFMNAESFNQEIGNWDVSSANNMGATFSGAKSFNQDIGSWDVSNVTIMNAMFQNAISFNQDISNWDVSNVTRMDQMFRYASNFNQPIGEWDMSKVTQINHMFHEATNFNGDISSWNLANVTDMRYMFREAISFNQDISNWNVSNVTNMSYMFYGASSFNQDLSSWDVSNVNDMSSMLSYSGIFPIYYDALLKGWLANGVKDNIKNFYVNGLSYCEGEGARKELISKHGWTITGDSKDCSQIITFDVLPSKTYGDPDFRLMGKVSSGASVVYSILDESIATISGDSVKIIGAGTTTIIASRPGNDFYEPALSVSRELKINKADQVIAFEPIPEKTIGDDAFDLVVTTDSGLEISFTSSNESVAKVEGNTVTIIGPGTVVITAFQEGNENYHAADPAEQILQVHKKPQSIVFEPALSKTILDDDFDLTAVASSGLDVVYTSSEEAVATVSNRKVSIMGIGETMIMASQPGNEEYEAAEDVSIKLIITKAPQEITFEPLPDMPSDAPDFDIVASASSGLQVDFSINGPANLEGNTISLTGMPGTVRVTASQAGNETYGPAESVVQMFEVFLKSAQTIAFDPIPTKYIGDDDFDLVATVGSGLEITFASSDESVATIVGRTVTIIGEGTTVITASQSGDDNYQAAIPVEQTLTVSKKQQTITFDALPSKTILDDDFDLIASSTSGLDVVYASSDELVATVVGNKVTIIGLGTTTITASQAGNAEYAEASDVLRELVITKVPQEITFEPIGDRSADAPNFEIIASASSGLPIIFTVSGPAAIEGNEVSLNGTPGIVSVTATQEGNDVYSPAEAVVRTFEVLAVPVTGVQDLRKEGISIYPNPIYDRLIIELAKNSRSVVYVSDTGGNIVLEDRLVGASNHVDVSFLSNGLYFIKIQLEDKVLYHKVVKE